MCRISLVQTLPSLERTDFGSWMADREGMVCVCRRGISISSLSSCQLPPPPLVKMETSPSHMKCLGIVTCVWEWIVTTHWIHKHMSFSGEGYSSIYFVWLFGTNTWWSLSFMRFIIRSEGTRNIVINCILARCYSQGGFNSRLDQKWERKSSAQRNECLHNKG